MACFILIRILLSLNYQKRIHEKIEIQSYMNKRKFSLQPYPFIMLLTALVTGILLQDGLQQIPPAAWLTGVISTTVLATVLHVRRSSRLSRSFIRSALLFLSFTFLGGILCYFQNATNNNLWYGKHLAKAQALKIQLDEAPVEKPKTLLLTAFVKSVNINGKWITTKGKLAVYVYKKNNTKQFKAGQTLLIPNEVVEIKPSGNPFSFDQKKYANRNGFFHQCFLSDKDILITSQKDVKPNLINRLKAFPESVIKESIKDGTTRALILAMVLNDRAQLEPELVNAYSTTGIIHIIAISGSHIMLLASIILLTIGKIPFIRNGRYIYAMLLVWIYISITGFPPSAVRAGVMFSIYAIANSLKRENQQINAWAASGFLLLCYNPYWIYDVGFQLSFLAVLSLLLFTKGITDWWKPQNFILDWLWKGIAVSISVQILVFPLAIYYFNQFPLLVFLANIPAGLFSVILMIGTMILLMLSGFGHVALWVGKALTFVTKAFHSFIFILSEYAPEQLKLLYIDAVEYWIIMAIIISICIFIYFKRPTYLFAGLAFSILFTLNAILGETTALHQEKVIVYNTNNESNISIIKGKKMSTLYPVTEKTYKYAIKPAMLGFRAIHAITADSSNNAFLINNKSVLVLGAGAIRSKESLPIDVLIVSNKCMFQPAEWVEIFHPELIVIDGSVARWKAAKWKETLTEAHVNVHWVQDSGAWIYPGM